MKVIILVITVLFLSGCSREISFTHKEKEIIRIWGDTIMPLYLVSHSEQELLLRNRAEKLTKKDLKSADFRNLKRGMLATVKDSLNEGVGIAAPQVGIGKCLIIVQRFDKIGEPFEFYINPEIVYYSESRKKGTEGCLSIPEIAGEVERSDTIRVKYLDETTFTVREETVSGFTAVIFQHETDHLNGILFIDRF